MLQKEVCLVLLILSFITLVKCDYKCICRSENYAYDSKLRYSTWSECDNSCEYHCNHYGEAHSCQ